MLLSIQYLRGVAAILVLMTHASYKMYVLSGSDNSNFSIGNAGVDLFFIISGFIICLSLDKQKIGPARFFINRIVRIIPMYWILTIVVLLVYLFNPGIVNSSGGETSIMGSFTLIPGDYKYLINNGWTLSSEESPNDFDKNHKFKVDAHLVM
ncbi:acyltransferase family protein [Vibrio cyclitrophicus]|uniref:acyltransferase family protein n=1 Tax=Vibrio cyclitrophicus TaxID=47951 RepID=UPI0032E525E1